MKTILLLVFRYLGVFLFAQTAFGAANLVVSGSPDRPGVVFSGIGDDGVPISTNGTDFAGIRVGTFERSTIKLTNMNGTNSTLTFNVSGIGPHFRRFGLPSSLFLLAGQSAEFEVEFAPTSIGVKTGVLTITSNDPDNPIFVINLSGVGVVPEADIFGGPALDVEIPDGDTTPRTADYTEFGDQDLFDGVISRTFRLKNNGTSDLLFIGASVQSGQGFTMTSLIAPASIIESGGIGNLLIEFDPIVLGTKTATVTVQTDDGNEGTYTFSVRGTGTVTAEIEIKGQSGILPLTGIANGSTLPRAIDGTSFPDAEVNSLPDSNLFQVINNGTGELTFSVEIDNPSFIYTNFQGEIVRPDGGQKVFYIFFGPTSPGIHSALVTVKSNAPGGNPYTFRIEGIGTAPEVTVLGDTDFSEEIMNGDDTPRVGDGTDFGDFWVGNPVVSRTFRVKNEGTSSVTFLNATLNPQFQGFSMTKPAANTIIPPQGHGDITVSFDPTIDGQVSTTLSVLTTDSANSPYTFDITANGVGNPDIEVKGNYVSLQDDGDLIPINSLIASTNIGTKFAEVELGQFQNKQFLLSNRGNATLTYSIVESSPDFEVLGLGSSLPPNQGSGSKDPFTIRFEPTSRGTKTLLIQVTSNDANTQMYNFAIEGKGIDPEMDLFGGDVLNVPVVAGISAPSASNGTSFGGQVVSSTGETHTFLIFNSGERNLVIASGNNGLADDTHFTVTGMPTSIQPILPNSSATFQITYEPQSAGKHSTTFQIISNDNDENPYSFRINGQGLDGSEITILGGPEQSVEIPDGHSIPSSVDGTDLGAVSVGQTITQTFDIKNEGNRNLTVTGPTIGGDFTASYSSGLAAPGGTITLTVTFTPMAAGTQVIFISIPNNDNDEGPYSFALRGEGTASTAPGDIEIRSVNGSVVIPQANTPNLSDGTDLGTVSQGTGFLVSNFRIYNTGELDLENISATGTLGVVITSLETTLGGDDSDVFTVSLPAGIPGVRLATITIASNDPDENPYIFTVRGTVVPVELPLLESFSISGTTGTFRFQSISGLTYQIYSSPDLEGLWSAEGIPFTGTGAVQTRGIVNLINPGEPRKFYRLQIVVP